MRKQPWMRHRRAHGCYAFDVAVVGGGLTGLSVSFHLKRAEPQLRIAIFESETVGFGASGRSGGVLIEHPSVFGSLSDVPYLREFVRTFGVECDWKTSRHRRGELCEDNHDLIDPMMLCSGLDRLCHEAGIETFEQSCVRCFIRSRRELAGAGFSVIAEQIVFATDAYSCPWEPIGPRLTTTAQPCIVVQVPLRARNRIPWTFVSEQPHGHGYFWGRRVGTRHFLLGGKEAPGRVAGVDSRAASSRLMTSLGTLLPELDGAVLASGWTGYIARFTDGPRRIVRTNDEVVYIGGYAGYGVAAAVRSGAAFVAARRGTETADFPVMKIGKGKDSPSPQAT